MNQFINLSIGQSIGMARKLGLIFFALMTFGLIGSAISQTTPVIGIRDKTPDLKVFINARIVVSPEMSIDSAKMIIKDGKILVIGSSNVKIPDEADIIDVMGKTIYPGFIETVSDYGLPKERDDRPSGRGDSRPPQYEGERIGGDAWNDAIHAEKNWGQSFRPSADDSKELMSLGFSMVQSVKLDGVFRGRSFVVLLGDGLPNDLLIKPYGSHFASFDKGISQQQYPGSLFGIIAMIRQTFYDVDWYQKAHQAYLLNNNQKMTEFNSAIEALSNIKNEKLIFEGNTESQTVMRSDRIADEFGYNFVHIAGGREYAWLDEVKNTGGTLIVPLDFPEEPKLENPIDGLDYSLYTLRHWETAPSNPARLESKDITFALTTHRLEKKKSFWTNLRTAMERGLTKEKAFAALTTVPAEICGVSNLVGTLEKGKLANFFICDGDIFDKECDIYSVWVAGKKYDISPFPVTEFSGEYSLTVNEQTLTLILEGKPAELSGKVQLDEWKEKIKSIDTERNFISFTTVIDSIKDSGVAHFTGRKENDQISGKCTLPNGAFVDWNANRIGDVPEEEPESDSTTTDESKVGKPGKRDRKDEDKKEELVAGFSYPNMAFGYESPPVQEDVIIKNTTIWTAEDAGILERTDILVKGGKFAKIGQNLEIPSGIRVIDASGKHVTPGIIDDHGHIAASGDINEGTFAITPEVRISDVVNPEDISIYRQLAGGVTTVMCLHGSANPIGGQNQTMKLRWGSNAENLKFKNAAPTIKFALGENVKQSNWGDNMRSRYPQSRMGVESIMRDVFQAAREYEQDWENYNNLPKKERARIVPPRKDIGLDAIVEVLNSERMVHCHSYVQSETLMMMRLAEQFGFTLDVFIHILEGYKVADEMARHGAMATTFSDWWAYKFEVYDAIPYGGALMAAKGVNTSFNSDSPDVARRLNQEAGKAILYGGMAPEEAIKLVTINPAKHLGADQYVGSIAEGKDADFAIWNDYPLSIYAKAEQTWIDGKKYFDLETDKRLREAVKTERNRLIQKILTSSKKGGGR
ncbi:MAG: amidohydrolase family protein [Candidatus Zixiibacteriota bacterium]